MTGGRPPLKRLVCRELPNCRWLHSAQ